MPVPRKTLTGAALAAGLALAAAPAAGAATLNGTVVGQPVVAKKSVVVPVLLSGAGERTARTALARVVVPRSGGLRSTQGRLAPGDLRIGDRVSASVARVSARPRAKALRIGRRAATPSFASMARQRSQVAASVQQAIDQAAKIQANPASLLDPNTPAADNFALREQLRAVRTRLNLLIADMRASADAFDATVAQIVAARPKDAARAAVAAQRQKATLDGLTADAAAGRKAADALDAAVAKLDTAMNAVGDPSTEPLPIDGLGAVSNLLYAVLDLLRGPQP